MDFLLSAKVAAIFLLILGNAFFVASEIALTSARRSRIAQLASEGNGSARIVQTLHANPERFYSVTQIGITLMSLALGAIGIQTFTEALDPPVVQALTHLSFLGEHIDNVLTSEPFAHTTAQVLAFLIVSTLHIVGGELAPKVYAFHHPESLSLSVSRIINILYQLFRWFIGLLNHMSNGLLWLVGQRDVKGPGGGHFSISEEELRTILVASESAGVLGATETAMIRGVFDLEKHTAGEVMTPRNLVIGIPVDATIDAALEIFRTDRHHRYPVFDGSIDRVVGILSIKELLNHIDLRSGASGEARRIRELMLPAYLIPETMSLKTLLTEFKASRQQMATVIDEFGGTAGLVTIEDVLEEIVGEFDEEYSPRSKSLRIRKHADQLLVDPRMRVDEFTEATGVHVPPGDYTTLSGFIYQKLERIPVVKDRVALPECVLTVEQMDGPRIVQISCALTRPSDAASVESN
ncbi:MAG TPA: hemolysin family protein [Pseudomonadales bacterium]|nr:hemolysin family protein [Pseudomonadales bacterium]